MKKKGLLIRNTKELLNSKYDQLIIELLNRSGYDVKGCLVDEIDIICDENFAGYIYINGKKIPCPDFVIILTLSTETSLAIVKMFESLGVLCINDYRSIDVATDKLLCQQKILQNLSVEERKGIHFPKTILVKKNTSAKFIGEQLGYPVVLKVMHGRKGKGVVLTKDERELKNILSMVTASKFDDQIIAQQAVMTSEGRDLRIVLCNGKYVSSYVRSSGGSDFRSNVSQGGSINLVDVPNHLKEVAEKISKILGFLLGSVDFMYGATEEEYYFCEANAMPGVPVTSNPESEFFATSQTLLSMIKQLVDNAPVPAWRKVLED